jgi:hypothetical protein
MTQVVSFSGIWRPEMTGVLQTQMFVCYHCGRSRVLELVSTDGELSIVVGPLTDPPFRGLTKSQRTGRKWAWRRPEREYPDDDW